jgi:predicted small integral membrane protein
MSLPTMLLFAQTGLTGILALWLSFGVRDNLLHPAMNGTFTAQVLALERMSTAYPDDFRLVQHRRITNPAVQRLLFRFIVACEVAVCLLLWSATIWMALSVAGRADPVEARTVALAGALGFTGIWSGFLIAGNHFAYWYCHEWAQNTHFQLALMGIGAMVLLATGSA